MQEQEEEVAVVEDRVQVCITNEVKFISTPLSYHRPELLLTFTANWKSDQKLPVERTPSCTRTGVGLPCLSSPPLTFSFMVAVVVGMSWSPSGGAADAIARVVELRSK